MPFVYGDKLSLQTPKANRATLHRLRQGRHFLPTHGSVLGTVAPPATVPCAHMEGADDILTPEEGLNEEPGSLTARVSLQEVGTGMTSMPQGGTTGIAVCIKSNPLGMVTAASSGRRSGIGDDIKLLLWW